MIFVCCERVVSATAAYYSSTYLFGVQKTKARLWGALSGNVAWRLGAVLLAVG